MGLPNKVVFVLEDKKIVTHIEESSRLIEELQPDEVIAAVIDLDPNDDGTVALMIFAAEDNRYQNHVQQESVGTPVNENTGFALKRLLDKAFVAGMQFGRSNPNATVELVEND